MVYANKADQLACQREWYKRNSASEYKRIYTRKLLIRDLIAAYKLEFGCIDCGYNQHSAALDFDHIPGTVKSFNLATAWRDGMGWEKIQAEIDKCEIVCANCHRVRTAEREALNT